MASKKPSCETWHAIVDGDGCVRLPRPLLKQLKWKVGTFIDIEVEDGIIRLSKSKTKKVRITLDIPEDILPLLKKAAASKGLTLSQFIEDIILRMVQDEHGLV